MKKKSIIWLFSAIAIVLAAVFVLLAVWGLKPSPKLNNLHIFCYPGLEWGMTMEEARNALGIDEERFYDSGPTNRFENDTYTSIGVAFRHQEFLGRDVQILLSFYQFEDSDELRLGGIMVDPFWENKTPLEGEQTDYLQLLEGWLKDQGAEYTVRTEPYQYAASGQDGVRAYIESKADLRDQPKWYLRTYQAVYDELVESGVWKVLKGSAPENPVDLTTREVALPLVSIRADILPGSGELEGDIPGTTLIDAREMAYLVAQSKK